MLNQHCLIKNLEAEKALQKFNEKRRSNFDDIQIKIVVNKMLWRGRVAGYAIKFWPKRCKFLAKALETFLFGKQNINHNFLIENIENIKTNKKT